MVKLNFTVQQHFFQNYSQPSKLKDPFLSEIYLFIDTGVTMFSKE